jgi:hypothetical protein
MLYVDDYSINLIPLLHVSTGGSYAELERKIIYARFGNPQLGDSEK